MYRPAPRESANGPGRVGRTLPIRLTTGRQPREFRARSRSTCRFSIPASVGKRKVNLSVLAVLRYWVHFFGSAASTGEDTVNRSAFPQEIAFATTGIVTGSERSTHYRNPAKTDTTLHRRTGSTTQGRRTHPRIRMGPSHLLGRQNDELQAASLVEAGIPIPHYSLSRPSRRLLCILPSLGNTIEVDPEGSLADRPGRPFRPASREGPGGVAAGDGSPRQATDRDVPGDGPTAS